jgi:hypothetical protein
MAEIAVMDRLVDLAGFPVDRLEAAEGRAFLARCRDQLQEDGALVLNGFLKAEAVDLILAQTEPLLPQSYYCAHRHNVYLTDADPRFAEDHARNRLVTSDLGCLADDQIPSNSALRAIYDWPELRAFLAAVLGYPRLHRYADPLGSLNINIAQRGQQLGWHFDNADFATTLLLQGTADGGAFEYAPAARNAEDDGYDRVGQILSGARDGIRTLALDPGSFVLFRGRYALHRVSPVAGDRPRIIAILSYDPQPGVQLSEFNRRLFYGRVA